MRYFHLGEGCPPFEFEYASTLFTIHPPDRAWKKVQEEYVIEEVKRHDGTIRERKGKRWIWVPDPKKSVARIINHIDLIPDQEVCLKNKMRLRGVNYIKSAAELDKDLKAEEDTAIIQHKKFMEDIVGERTRMMNEMELLKATQKALEAKIKAQEETLSKKGK